MIHIKTRTVVRDNAKACHFVAYVDGDIAGRIEYELHGGQIWVLVTHMDPRCKEPGVEEILIGAMLQELQRRRLELLPFCLRTRAYLAKHPHHLALIAPDDRQRFKSLPVGFQPIHPQERRVASKGRRVAVRAADGILAGSGGRSPEHTDRYRSGRS